MATADADIAELALSLSVEDTPVKLRCATCSHIAYNALRLPCCEQNICETCYNDLEDMCQVCHHEPLNKSLCTPNKSLRTTTKVFLKKKLFERAKEQKKKEDDAPKSETIPVATGDSLAGNTSATLLEDNVDAPATTSGNQQQLDAVTPAQGGEMSGIEAGYTEDNEHQITTEPSKSESSGNQQSGEEQSAPHDESLVSQNEPTDAQNDPAQDASWQNGDMSAMMNGGFNGMNGQFPMDFSQMMAGGMQMPGAGFPNMMGMGMDPMMNQMSQAMFGGFGGPNMGMNGMGTNMGAGFSGQNQFGGPWMGQGAFNGHGNNGGFGGQGGYNMSSHGNFNQMNQQYHNDYSNGYGRHGFYGRGGRGRRGGYYNGGYSRNYHGYNQNGYANHASNHAYQQQSYQTGASATASAGADSVNVSADNQATEKEDEARLIESFAPGGENDDAPVDREQVKPQNDSVKENHKESNEPVLDATGAHSEGSHPKEAGTEQGDSDQNKKIDDEVNEDKPLPIQSIVSDEPRTARGMPPPGPHVPQGPSGRGFSRGKPYNPNGTANIPVVTEPIGVGVAGAPTGPKALREGLPNTSRSAFLARAQPQHPALTPAAQAQAPRKEESMKSPSPPPRRSRSGSRSHPRSRSRSRSRTKSPERQHDDRHRTSRHRSRSRSANGKYESRDERSHRRSRRYEEDDRVEEDGSSRRSSHRSRRYQERDPESSSHRRHRDRSYEREKDKDRYYDYEKEREKDRDREYDDDRHRRRSKRSRSPVDSSLPTPTSAHPPDYAYEDESSRKRRSREDDYEKSYDRHDRHDRKRSKRDHSASPDRHAPHLSHSREASKPSTPATPSFPTGSRRQSDLGTGVPGAPSGPSKPIPTGPRASFSHGGRRDRERERDRERDRDSSYRYSERPNHSSTNGHADEASKAPEKDPHTLEREARDRERLMKEMQRRATMEGPKRKGSMSIRGSARRSGVKYEDEDEENAMRVEREREGARWR